MAVPKRRRSKAKTRTHHSMNDRKTPAALSYCDACGRPKAPHRTCTSCGHYNAARGKVLTPAFVEQSAEE